MASAVRKYDTAFSAAPAKATKRPRQKIEAHLAFIRTLPCLITGKRPVRYQRNSFSIATQSTAVHRSG